jgi:hypothetical protein
VISIENCKSNRASIDFVSFSFPKPNGKRFINKQRIKHSTREIIEREERKKVKMVTASRLHSDKDRRLRENGELLNKVGKPLFGHIESRFEDDRIRILDSTGVEIMLGDVNTDKDGEVLRHTKTSFRLIRLKGEGRGLLNQTSSVTRVKNPTNLSWLKAGDRLLEWLESQGIASRPALPIF